MANKDEYKTSRLCVIKARKPTPSYTELGFSLLFLSNLCYLYSLVKMDCDVLFYLVYFCVFLQCFDTVGWAI